MYITEKELKFQLSAIKQRQDDMVTDLASDIVALHSQLVSTMAQLTELTSEVHRLTAIIESIKNV